MSARNLKAPANENGHSQRCGCRNTGVHHVGLYAKDPAASAAFYCGILGMRLPPHL
jgi:hypothetical protein